MSNMVSNKQKNILSKDRNTFSIIRWTLIALVFILYVIVSLRASKSFNTFESIVFSIYFITICMHGIKRYGVKNLVVFFVITAIVGNFFESLSIYTGFPFGNYHYYLLSGPRIFEVPIIIMFAYFSVGYLAWTLAHVLYGQYGKKLKGIQIFLIPLIASFIMVMWDVVMDPIYSTVKHLWIWENGGSYFNIPISNYLGWFLVVYIFLQIFAIYISKFDTRATEGIKNNYSKLFWLEASALYGIRGMNYILEAMFTKSNNNIYNSVGLVCVFTMIFVVLLSSITIINSNNIVHDE